MDTTLIGLDDDIAPHLDPWVLGLSRSTEWIVHDSRRSPAGRRLPQAGVVSHVFLGSKHGLHQGFENFDEELVQATSKSSHLAITSPEITCKAIRFLEEQAAASDARTWFLWVHYFDPHRGRHPPRNRQN